MYFLVYQKTFKKFVRSQRGVLDSKTDFPESLREIRRLLQIYIETESTREAILRRKALRKS